MRQTPRRLMLVGPAPALVADRQLGVGLNGSLAMHLEAMQRKTALRRQQLSFSRDQPGNHYDSPQRPTLPT